MRRELGQLVTAQQQQGTLHKGDKDDETTWYAHDRVQRILTPAQEPPEDTLISRTGRLVEPEYKVDKLTRTQRYKEHFPFAEER